jgi:hypothetical protein
MRISINQRLRIVCLNLRQCQKRAISKPKFQNVPTL